MNKLLNTKQKNHINFYYKLTIMISALIIIFSCKQKKTEDKWLVFGDNIEVVLSEYKINFFENSNLIFEAVTDKEKIKSNLFKISNVGNDPIYLAKYPIGKDIKIIIENISENEIKIYIDEPLKRFYRLVKDNNFNFEKKGIKYLNYITDIDDFINETLTHRRNLYTANELYFVEVTVENRQWDEKTLKEMIEKPHIKWIIEEPYRDKPEKKPIRDINTMEDFIVDNNEKTSWIAGKPGKSHTIDFSFKSLQGGMMLEHNLNIKAIGFYTGYAERANDFVRYNRIKHFKILFSENYRGGIGRNKICYDYKNYKAELPDRQGLQILYFQNSIPAKSLRILIEDCHLGYDNIIALNGVIFYIIDSKNI